MADFEIRSDNVDVEQIMRQIRSRIREKRGVDYTEEEIRELARVKLEKFLDPTGVRSDLLQQFRKAKAQEPPPRNYAFEDTTIFETHRTIVRWIRKILKPILKLFFNPNPIAEALHIQAEINRHHAKREELDALHYELVHNLVLETTRLGIEVKNLKMRVESMSSRLDFDERRARALEGVVQYRPGAVPPLQPPAGAAPREGDAAQQERRTRRRRRRGRKPGSAREASGENGAAAEPQADAPESPSPPENGRARDRGRRGWRPSDRDRHPAPQAAPGETPASETGRDRSGQEGMRDNRITEPEASNAPPAADARDFAPPPRAADGEPVAPTPTASPRRDGEPVAPKPPASPRGEGE
jgi:hypothetical protein